MAMVFELAAVAALLTAVGTRGAASISNLSPDVRAALAFPLGVGSVALASPLVEVGVPPLGVALGVTVASLGVLAVWRPAPDGVLRASGWPLAVLVASLAIAAAPAMARGTWAAETNGNADVYLWASQARSLADGPPAAPATTNPDRLAWERLSAQHWAEALPVALASLSWAEGGDPARVTALVAALLAALTPLLTYVAGREALGLARWHAGVAGLAVAGGGMRLAVLEHGWIPHLAGVGFSLGCATALYVALVRGGSRRLELLAAAFAGAALASYRLPGSGILALFCAVAVGAALADRRLPVRSLGRFALLTTLVAAPSLVAVARGLHGFLGRQLDEQAWRMLPSARPWEGVGFVTRTLALSHHEGRAELALALLSIGALSLGCVWALRRGHALFALLGVAAGVLGALVPLVTVTSDYLSFKLVAYTAPFAVLAAVLPLESAARSAWGRLAAIVLVGVFVGARVLYGLDAYDGQRRYAASIPEIERVAARVDAELEPGRPVAIAVGSPWLEAWLVYALRGRPLALACPSPYFTGIGLELDPASFGTPADATIVVDDGRPALARGAGVALVEQTPAEAGGCPSA